MEFDKVTFHGLGALESVPGLGENGLVRIPAPVRNKLNERARFIGMDSVGIEAQFVTDAPNIDLYLSVLKPEFGMRGEVRVYCGDYLHQTLEVEPGCVHMFRVTPPAAFAQVRTEMLKNGGSAPEVYRVVFGRSTYVLHGIETHGHALRPPRADELPRTDWLAYGSSITNSGLDGYAHIAARALGFQVQNLGFSGACHIEKALVDYMLDERAFDIISCELGINMLNSHTPEVFRELASYLVERLTALGKPAIIITAFPSRYMANYAKSEDEMVLRDTAFRRILEELVEQAGCRHITLVRGDELLASTDALSSDLVHPVSHGHAQIGFNLAARMKDFLRQALH